MQIQYQLRNKIYTIADCSKNEIPSHIERVSQYWSQLDESIEDQVARLQQCVDLGVAVKILDEKNKLNLACYTIPHPKDKSLHLGQMLWTTSNRFIALFFYWLHTHKKVYSISFMPINIDLIPFIKIVEDMSIQKYYNFHTSLRVNLFKGKANRFVTKYVNLYNIQELPIKE